MLTSPLNLRLHKKSFPSSPGSLPFLSLLSILFFLSWSSHSITFPPGLPINLPSANHSILSSLPTSATLSIDQSQLIFFEGNLAKLSSLESLLLKHIKKFPNNTQISLLLKFEPSTPLSTLFSIASIAKKTGYHNVLLAANSSDSL